LHKGRLRPGDVPRKLDEGSIVDDTELKQDETEKPYGEWLGRTRSFNVPPEPAPTLPMRGYRAADRFGYTVEDLKYILGPMARQSEEAVGSMGTDTPLAVLSDRAQPLYNYFKQLFAQVTNPPLDAIREELVTSVKTLIGPEGNLLDPQPESARMINVEMPFLDNGQLAKLKAMKDPYLRATVLPILFPAREGPTALDPPWRSCSAGRMRR
jgi:glutamate synthase (ferredoxin)